MSAVTTHHDDHAHDDAHAHELPYGQQLRAKPAGFVALPVLRSISVCRSVCCPILLVARCFRRHPSGIGPR